MRRGAGTRACQFLWLLLGLTALVEGRVLPTAGAEDFEVCRFPWQIPGTDCWPPIGQSPHCDHLHNGGCAGSPPSHVGSLEWKDPDCKPVPGRLPPIRCQDPRVYQAAEGAILSHNVWTELQDAGTALRIHCDGCTNWPPRVTHGPTQPDEKPSKRASSKWEDPDCKPVPGRLPPIRCQDPHLPRAADGAILSHNVWTELQEDGTSLRIHCDGCTNWPPRVTHRPTEQHETPSKVDPSTKAARPSVRTAKDFEACQFTWQIPGTDCWPPSDRARTATTCTTKAAETRRERATSCLVAMARLRCGWLDSAALGLDRQVL